MPTLPNATTGRVTKLRVLMLETGMPNYQIAARLDVSPTRLSEYALGRRPIPTRRIYHFCQFFRVDVDKLLGWEDE